MSITARTLLMLLAVAATFGCVSAPGFRVNVDSINDPSIQVGSRYILLPAMDGVTPSDLQFREYAAYIHGALERRGFVATDDLDQADIAIFVRYGLGDPRSEAYSYSIPTYGQTGGGTATYSGSTYGTGGSTYSSGTVTQTPTYGVTGSQTISGTRTSYFRFLSLDAIDLSTYSDGSEPVPVWKTTVTSRGSSDDLRRVLPVLVGASEEHIGSNTGTQIRINLYETDERVLRVRGESPK